MEYKAELFLRNVNNLSDARFAASEGFFAISYNLSPTSTNFMTTSKLKELNEWVTGPLKIAEFEETIPDLINDSLEQTGLELAMIPYSSSLKDLKEINYPVIIKLTSADLNEIKSTKLDMAEYVFIELNKDILKNRKELVAMKTMMEDRLVFLAVENDVDKTEVVDALNPFGLVLRGGKEAKPGIKNYERLNAEVEEMKY